jgi:hypothetical protein
MARLARQSLRAARVGSCHSAPSALKKHFGQPSAGRAYFDPVADLDRSAPSALKKHFGQPSAGRAYFDPVAGTRAADPIAGTCAK